MKTNKKRNRVWIWLVLALTTLVLVAAIGGCCLLYAKHTSNIYNYKTIGEIPVPAGYERLNTDQSGYSEFLRSLPLKPKGTEVKLFTGGRAHLQILNYAVVDLPILSNWEQCADVCMHLRAEFLFRKGRFNDIKFEDVNRELMAYGGGNSRQAFEKYLRKVYGMASTYSLVHEMKKRKFKDIQVGDVFVYAARPGHRYGHAIMVVDVAVNSKTGERMCILAEGATPARDIHVIRNVRNPLCSPWFKIDQDADVLTLFPFHFYSDELRHF